jgi:hypothetical protein
MTARIYTLGISSHSLSPQISYPKRTSRKIRVVPEKLKGPESYHTSAQRCAGSSVYEVWNPLHTLEEKAYDVTTVARRVL